MKRPVIMGTTAVALGFALAIGVPGIGAEQQAQALAGCTNSVTCNPANMPMMVEGGFITIGQNGLVTTGVIAPVAPAGSAFPITAWVGGVLGVVGTAIHGWSLKVVADLNGQEVNVEGEVMTSEGVPEMSLKTAPGTQFDNGTTAAGRCFDANPIVANLQAGTATVTQFPGSTCDTELVHMFNATYGNRVTYSLNGLGGTYGQVMSVTATRTQIGGYVTDPIIRGVYWNQNTHPLATQPNSAQWAGPGQILSQGTKNYVFGSNTAGYVLVGVMITFGNGVQHLVWSKAGPAPEAKTDTQRGSMIRTMDCRNPEGIVSTVDNVITGMMGGPGALTMAPLKCPPGTLPIDTGTTWKPETGPPVTIIPKRVVIPKPITEMEKYPDCWKGTCTLTLERTNGDSCGKVGELCPDWSRDPNRSQNYVCKFGGKIAPLNMCSAYRSPSHGVLPNVDKATGEYLDPSAPVPGNFGQTPTNPVTNAPITTVPTVTNQPQKDCRPSSFFQMLNPFYMFQAVQCAITETFVPKADFVKANNLRIIKAMEGTTPALLAAEVGNFKFITPASSCGGVSLDLRWLGAGFVQVMNACPGSALAPLVFWSRLLGNIGFSIWGVVAISRHVSAVINYRGLGE